MNTRTQRLLAIRRIIEGEDIHSQELLLRKLEKAGFNLTQATLSRDLKFLQVGKLASKEKGYVYRLPDAVVNNNTPPAGTDAFPMNGYVSIDFANHLCVIRTLPGYAAGVAARIDDLEAFEIIGTIAGDDTILLIPREGVSREDVINVLSVIIPII